MKRMSIFATLLAGALAFGCGSMRHDKSTTVQPHAVTGAAGTTSTGIDTTANPTSGTATGTPAGTAPNPDEPPGLETGADSDVNTQQMEGERQEKIDVDDSKTDEQPAPNPNTTTPPPTPR
jgi:hypothetical protein